MSSAYLTSADMLLIERLLAEYVGDCPRDKETAAARLLIHAMERGTCDEKTLRELLARYVRRHRTIDAGLAEWEWEGGALPQAA